MLLKQGQQSGEVFVEIFNILEKQFFAFDEHPSIAAPNAVTHESVEEVFQADVMEVAVQVVVGPPQQSPEVNLPFRLVMALGQKLLIMLDERQFAPVVGKVDAKKAPGVPRIHR